MDTHTAPTTAAARTTRIRRLLAAAVGLVVALTALAGLGSSPAGAFTTTPRALHGHGFDQAGPSGYHRLVWGEPELVEDAIDAWQVQRWNADDTQLLATYQVNRNQGPDLVVPNLPDSTTFRYRVRSHDKEGWNGWSPFVGVQVHPGVTHAHPYGTEADFVRRQYQDLLGRQPSVGELSTATTTIHDAPSTAAWITTLAGRAERVDVRHPVIRLYLAYFDRAPDAAGLAHWEGQLRSGKMSLKAISAYFAQSPEFKTTYGKLTNVQFVELVYQNVLGRTAAGDPGAAFWANELSQGKRSRGDVMVGFSESAEGKKLRRAEVIASDLWLAMVKTKMATSLMQAYAPIIEAEAQPGDLALLYVRLLAYKA